MDKTKTNIKSNVDKSNVGKTDTSTNLLPDFSNPMFFYPILFIIITLIVFLIKLFIGYNIIKGVSSLSGSKSSVASDIIMTVIFVLIILILCISLIPNLKKLKQLFEEIGNVTYAIIYTIFIILFFTMTSSETLDKYYYLIVPFITLLGLGVFYKCIQSNYIDKFNINYERIKTLILFFCVLTIMIVYYSVDPGGLIQKYFGHLMLLTIIIAVFIFLYLIIVLTLPSDKPSITSSNLLNNYSNFSVYGTLLFVIFLIIITILISTYPGGFFSEDNKVKSSAVMIFTLLVCIFWSILIISNMFPEISDKKMDIEKLNLFKRALLMLFGLVITIIMIVSIIYAIQNKSGKSGTVSLVVNILLILLLLGIIYKTIFVKTPSNKSESKDNSGHSLYDFMMKIILYLPSVLPNIYHYLMKLGDSQNTGENSYWYMLILAILLLTIYFYYPSIYNKFILQGGKLLINQPIYTNTEVSLGTYQTLNGSDTFDYNYALSFWIFLNSFPPNTNTSYRKYTSLLSYGGKPNILYNASENTLLITMKQKGLEEQKGIEDNIFIEFDENGNRILYKNTNMLLQKWNHIVLNYHGGILDIFLNGELVKSVSNIVQYYTLDSLTVGENNGFNGGISSIVYYHKILTKTDIHFIYNTLKNEENPVTKKDDNTTIMKLL
jgi:cytochrome bd-type quinol oxidase subunit 2